MLHSHGSDDRSMKKAPRFPRGALLQT